MKALNSLIQVSKEYFKGWEIYNSKLLINSSKKQLHIETILDSIKECSQLLNYSYISYITTAHDKTIL